MMEEHIGADRFQKGIQAFLKDADKGWMDSEGLLRSLQQPVPPAEINIDAVYRNWIWKKGFPLVKVEEASDGVWITQERFHSVAQSADNTTWSIPIRFCINGAAATPFLFNTDFKIVEEISPGQLYKFNLDHQGFYITCYDDWNRVRNYVATHPLTSRDTAGLLLDVLYLITSDNVRLPEVYALVGEVLNQSNTVVTWNVGNSLTNVVSQYIRSDPVALQQFSNTVQGWLAGKYDSEMWNEEGKTPRQIRHAALVIEIACGFGLSQCLLDAKNQFTHLRNGTENREAGQLPQDAVVRLITPNIRGLVFCYGLKTSQDPQDLQFLLNLLPVAPNGPLLMLKAEIARGICCVQQQALKDM